MTELDLHGASSQVVEARRNVPTCRTMATVRQGGVSVTTIALQRMEDQSVIINDNIVVTVIEVRGDRVRLGIEYPRDVSVHRREVYEALQAQARTGSESRPPD